MARTGQARTNRKGGNRSVKKTMDSYTKTISDYASTGAKALATAKAAYEGVQYVKGLVNSELLKRTTAGDDVVKLPLDAPFNYDCFHLTALPSGDGDDERTGNSVLMKYLDVRMYFNWGGNPIGDTYGVDPNAQQVRVLIVRDTQTVSDSADPGLTNIIQSRSVIAHLNSNTVGRFTILRDTNITLDRYHPTKYFEWKIAPNAHARYNGDTEDDIQKNAIYLLIFGESASPSSSYHFEFRLSYHDN